MRARQADLLTPADIKSIGVSAKLKAFEILLSKKQYGMLSITDISAVELIPALKEKLAVSQMCCLMLDSGIYSLPASIAVMHKSRLHIFRNPNMFTDLGSFCMENEHGDMLVDIVGPFNKLYSIFE